MSLQKRSLLGGWSLIAVVSHHMFHCTCTYTQDKIDILLSAHLNTFYLKYDS